MAGHLTTSPRRTVPSSIRPCWTRQALISEREAQQRGFQRQVCCKLQGGGATSERPCAPFLLKSLWLVIIFVGMMAIIWLTLQPGHFPVKFPFFEHFFCSIKISISSYAFNCIHVQTVVIPAAYYRLLLLVFSQQKQLDSRLFGS